MVCHWVTVVLMVAAVIAIKVFGILPDKENFDGYYDFTLPAMVGQIAFDWTM